MNDRNKEEIIAINKRNVQLKFIVGITGSGKATMANKIEQEFGMQHISTSILVREESKKDTILGKSIKDYIGKGGLIPTDIIISLLLKTIVNTQGSTFLISGFPRTLDQALFIEKEIQEISYILNFDVNEDVAIKKIKNKYKDMSDSAIELTINEYKVNTVPFINFYRRFGIVRDINADQNINIVYNSVKEALLPEIYCVLGKRYSGKSTISKLLEERMNFKHLCFNSFLARPEIKKRINDDEWVMNNFLNLLRQESNRKVLIENFPLTENQYKLFIKNGKPIKKVFVFNTEDHIASERMMQLSKESPNFVGCTKLKEDLDAWKISNPTSFLKKVPGLIKEFDLNNHLTLDFNEIVNQIKPKVLIFGGDACDKKNSLINHFIEKGFSLINVIF